MLLCMLFLLFTVSIKHINDTMLKTLKLITEAFSRLVSIVVSYDYGVEWILLSGEKWCQNGVMDGVREG